MWLCRLGDPTEAISSAGIYNVRERKLTISPAFERAWAFTGTSSELLGLFWSNSGAAAYNAVLAPEFYFDIMFNEARPVFSRITLLNHTSNQTFADVATYASALHSWE
jgi:hypothetical protein